MREQRLKVNTFNLVFYRKQFKFELRASRLELRTASGDHAGGVPPVPISNTEVKTSRADDTWGASPWQSRSSPGNKRKTISNEVVFSMSSYTVSRRTGVPPVRSTLLENASWVAVWRKARPLFVSRTRKLRIHTAGVCVSGRSVAKGYYIHLQDKRKNCLSCK